EKIDLAGPSRRVRGAGQHASAGQRVDEARFADIRTAEKRDFRKGFGRQRLSLGAAGDKAAVPREQEPPGLDQLRLDLAWRKQVGRCRAVCQAAPARCMIAHCWAMLSR